MKEVGKEFAKGIAESVAGEVSKTASDLLGLEEWAKSEIGIGIAKLVTGIDPKKEASREAEQAYLICNQLESWISLSAARNYGRGETLKSCIEEAERLQNAIDAALKSFEEAVANFRCVKCRLPPNIAEDLERLRNKLSDYIRAFGDMIDQIKSRLKQAIRLYNMKEVYESPYTWARRSQDRERAIRRALRNS